MLCPFGKHIKHRFGTVVSIQYIKSRINGHAVGKQ